ncbi:hypothetical protein F5Y15DRAFT_417353 [Xylariaceae sp. FL0016]|nr:hypothetical protein F5Y15DRAFT_417353 [Xylariaceae sp. FL0016]
MSWSPLTTTFTPSSGCTNSYLQGLTDNILDLRPYPVATCTGGTWRRYGCYPDTTTYGTRGGYDYSPVITYSPGNACPIGMTSVAAHSNDESISDGTWCCPSGLAVSVDFYCAGMITEGVVTISYSTGNCQDSITALTFGPDITGTFEYTDPYNSEEYGPYEISSLSATVTLSAILLLDQTSDSETTTTSGTFDPARPTPGSPLTGSSGTATITEVTETTVTATTGPANKSSKSNRTVVGASVGGALGGTLLLALGIYVCWKRRLRCHIYSAKDDSRNPPQRNDEFTGKPELEGTPGRFGVGLCAPRAGLEAPAFSSGRAELMQSEAAELEATSPTDIEKSLNAPAGCDESVASPERPPKVSIPSSMGL